MSTTTTTQNHVLMPETIRVAVIFSKVTDVSLRYLYVLTGCQSFSINLLDVSNGGRGGGGGGGGGGGAGGHSITKAPLVWASHLKITQQVLEGCGVGDDWGLVATIDSSNEGEGQMQNMAVQQRAFLL